MEQGRIDVLVNTAGYGSFGTLEEVDPAEGRRQFDVNVLGLARMTQLVLPAMRQAPALRRVLPDRLYDAAVMAVLKRVASG